MDLPPRKAFTLVELLIVIAIIAILAIVVILVLNPFQLLKQSRDSSRLSDAATLKNALGIYAEDVGGSMGSSSIVYVSIPDPLATSSAGDQCQGLGLPAAAGNTYQCASSSTFRSVNGTGWIPLNLKSISFGSPISNLPIDPTNTSSSGEFYTYQTNGAQYETTMALESSKNTQTEASDAGQYSDLYEQGTNLALAPIDFYGVSISGGGGGGGGNTLAYNISKAVSLSTTTVLSFTGIANTTISLVSISNFSICNLDIEIYNPAGGNIGGSNCSGNSSNFNNVTVATSGTYTVTFIPVGSGSSTVALSQSTTSTLALNSSTTFANTVPGQFQTFSFVGTAGASISLVSISNFSICNLDIEIYNPAGGNIGGSNCSGNSTSFNNIALSSSGTYKFTVNTDASTGSGTLTLSQSVTSTLPFNTPTAVGNTIPGQGHILTFTGTASSTITLTSISSFGICNLDIEIYNPAGRNIAGSNCSGNNTTYSGVLTTTNGTYTIYVNPNVSLGTLTFTLTTP